MPRALLAVAIGLATLAAPALHAQDAAAPAQNPRAVLLAGKLQGDLEKTAADFDGVMGIEVKDLTNGEVFSVNADTIFPQASSIKIAVLLELLRQAQEGKLRLRERVEVKQSQMVGGSGALEFFGDGTSSLALRDLAVLMIVLSDNTATNILIDRVGMGNVNTTLARLGLKDTWLERRMMDVTAERADRENHSTPREMAALLERLYRGELLDAERTRLALEILRDPKETPLRAGLPPDVPLADKPGSIGGVRCDSGIVLLAGRPYVISVMTTYDADDGDHAIAEVSRRVFRYFDLLAHSNSYGVRLP